ncbi:MAG: hypothetical protein M3N52_00960 [Actinomycetota bacterium]|nr:hypothetical protein [Actinomycetota bacterium]
MAVIDRLAAWPDSSTEVERRPFDAEAATLFLRAQASWLCRGLRRAGDPIAVRLVLGSHDACHGRWLALIDQVGHSLRPDLAQQLAELYALHGRVAGSLERGVDGRLDPRVADKVRGLLAAQLSQLTEAAIDRLRLAADANGPPQR